MQEQMAYFTVFTTMGELLASKKFQIILSDGDEKHSIKLSYFPVKTSSNPLSICGINKVVTVPQMSADEESKR